MSDPHYTATPTSVQLLVMELSERTIAFHPFMARTFGGIHEAIFLQQLTFWCKHNPDDWFWHTQDQIEKETCIPRRYQESARRHLVKLGVIEEQRKGIPSKMHFRVVWARLVDVLETELRKQECTIRHSVMDDPPNSDGRSAIVKRRKEETTQETPISPKTKHRIPDDYGISDDLVAVAVDAGMPDFACVRAEFEKFKLHHQSKGTTMLRWDLAWKTWCLNWKSWHGAQVTNYVPVAKPVMDWKEAEIAQQYAERERFLAEGDPFSRIEKVILPRLRELGEDV